MNIHGQSDTIKKALWINGGLLFSSDAPGVEVSVNYKIRRNVFSAEWYGAQEPVLENLLSPKQLNRIQQIRNLSVLYGYSLSGKWVGIMPVLGISYGECVWRNNHVDTTTTKLFFSTTEYYTYHYDKFKYVGIQTALCGTLMVSNHFGISLKLFENFHRHADRGLIVSLLVGRIK